jgi:NTP pyrophosphatase (non-canonical NTP hydrolase)
VSVSGHELARELIARHGTDRYPTPELQALKVVEELGELVREILRDGGDPVRVRKEYADTGLALYALGDKLGMDLEAEMAEVVGNETRRFA